MLLQKAAKTLLHKRHCYKKWRCYENRRYKCSSLAFTGASLSNIPPNFSFSSMSVRQWGSTNEFFSPLFITSIMKFKDIVTFSFTPSAFKKNEFDSQFPSNALVFTTTHCCCLRNQITAILMTTSNGKRSSNADTKEVLSW